MTVYEDKMITLDLIRRPAYPDRLDADVDSLAELMDSMTNIGLLHPIAVKPIDNGFEVISGDRRLTAATALGWTEVWCTVHRDLSPLDVSVMRAQENLQRQNLSPMEEAFAVRRVYIDHQMSITSICDHFNRSHKWVSSRLALCDLSESLRISVHSGALPISHALALAAIKDDVTRESMHGLCRAEGATLSVLLGWIQDYNREIHDIPPVDPTLPPGQDTPQLEPAVGICTICGQEERLTELVWRPICRPCRQAADG